MSFLKRLLSRRKAPREFDHITFDVPGFTLTGDKDGQRVWNSEIGDGIGLYYFPIPPDIPKNAVSIGELKQKMLEASENKRLHRIEFEILLLDECRVLKQILGEPQQPHGVTYLGSIIIPFRDCSYVVMAQCIEYGMTGIREATLAPRARKDGTIRLKLDEKGELHQIGVLDSNAERFDAEFPDHPLSRVRVIMSAIEQSLQIDAAAKANEGFDLPPSECV